MRKLKILIYADVDLNYVDGSAIWLTSVCDVLSGEPMFEIHALLKAPLKNTTLIDGMINRDRIVWVDPYKHFSGYTFKNRNRMTQEDALFLQQKYGGEIGIDYYFLRQIKPEILNVQSEEFLRRCFIYLLLKDGFHDEMKVITQRLLEIAAGLMVQTSLMRNRLAEWLECDPELINIMTPMIPDKELPEEIFICNQNSSLVYTGKFAAMWYIQETIDIVKRLQQDGENIKFDVAGDKFHDDVDKEALISQFKEIPNITWHGRLDRSQSTKLIESCDVGIGWRSSELDDSLEVSTKFLEYAMMGKPVLLNPTVMHKEMLGEDYPLFVDTPESFYNKVRLVFSDLNIYLDAAHRCYKSARCYGYREALERLRTMILTDFWEKPLKRQIPLKKKHILIAGHDLKFIRFFIDYLESMDIYEVKIDNFENHTKQDKIHNQQLLDWADVIFCEWGLGNSVWYSKNKKTNQALIVRMHNQELRTAFPEQFNMSAIDKFIIVGPYTYEKMCAQFKLPRHKTKLIWNAVNCELFQYRHKNKHDSINLGILGICPKMKRVDLALDVLEQLIKADKNAYLYIKGRRPEEYAWLWENEEERVYYENIYQRIHNIGEERVVFLPHGDDVSNWFSQIDYLLSTSDFESFHLSVAEAMASGVVPLIRDWEGSETIYRMENIFHTTEDMANFIISGEEINNKELREYVYNNFNHKLICQQLEDVLLEALDSKKK